MAKKWAHIGKESIRMSYGKGHEYYSAMIMILGENSDIS
jgi:hypothetical protein